jgi:hypothetical protein
MLIGMPASTTHPLDRPGPLELGDQGLGALAPGLPRRRLVGEHLLRHGLLLGGLLQRPPDGAGGLVDVLVQKKRTNIQRTIEKKGQQQRMSTKENQLGETDSQRRNIVADLRNGNANVLFSLHRLPFGTECSKTAFLSLPATRTQERGRRLRSRRTVAVLVIAEIDRRTVAAVPAGMTSLPFSKRL